MTRTAIYSLQDNALTIIRESNKCDYSGWDELTEPASEKVPCHDSARSLWKDGQKVQEGKDYEVREVDWMPETEEEYNQAMYEAKRELTGPVPKVLTAFPLPVRSEPKLEMKELPEPVGQFIIDQPDIKPLMMPNGAYYHYVDVIKMLVRYKDYSPVKP